MSVSEGKRYRLPFQAMLGILSSSGEHILLHAHISQPSGKAKQNCMVEVVVRQGKLLACTILDAHGAVVLQHQEAYQALLQAGDLEWQVISLPSPYGGLGGSEQSSERAQPPMERASIPVSPGFAYGSIEVCVPSLRHPPLSETTLATLSQPYRMLLLLVDGRRPIAQLARLLSRSPDDIGQMLRAIEHLVRL